MLDQKIKELISVYTVLKKIVSKYQQSEEAQPLVIALKEALSAYEQRCLPIEETLSTLSEHDGLFMISLIGMVNVGKSSFGNILVQKPGYFREGSIRETTQEQFGVVGDHIVVCDLPGLGSVEMQKDDPVVRRRICRSDLLIFMIAANQTLMKHYYDFVRDYVPQGKPCLLILNKMDIPCGGLPHHERRKEFDKIRQSILHGDANTGAKGLAKFIHENPPFFPFSCREYYQGNTAEYGAIQKEIERISQTVVPEMGARKRSLLEQHSGLLLYLLMQFFSKTSPYIEKALETAHHDIQEKWTQFQTSMDARTDTMIATTSQNIRQTLQGAYDALKGVDPPNWFQRTFETEYWEKQKNLLWANRYIYREEISRILTDFRSEWKSCMKSGFNRIFSQRQKFPVASPSDAIENFQEGISAYCDYVDDVFIRGFDADDRRYKVTNSDQFDKAGWDAFSQWIQTTWSSHMTLARNRVQKMLDNGGGVIEEMVYALKQQEELLQSIHLFSQK